MKTVWDKVLEDWEYRNITTGELRETVIDALERGEINLDDAVIIAELTGGTIF